MSQQCKWEIFDFPNRGIGDGVGDGIERGGVETTDFVAPDEMFFCGTGLETDFKGCPTYYTEPQGVIVFSPKGGEEGVDCGGDGLALGGALGLVF